MDRTEESKPTSRRKQILDAAFFLATKSEVWSLADIAAVVGVSKTAIYRHFTNRAEIEEEMTRELIEAVSTAIDTAKESPNAIRLAVVSLLRAKPGYLQYIVQRIITTEGFVPIMIESLISQNERIASFFSRLERLRKGVQSHIRADLLISSVSVIIASFADDRLRLIQDQLLESLARGFPELQAVTESRLAELDKICLLEKRNEEESDRLISAIARTIQAHGLKNTTIENIAQEMGMAKSSLYFYCKNKNEMLASLIKHETSSILNHITSRLPLGTSFSEQLYIVMAVQSNYLLVNPDLIPVFNWIRYVTFSNDYQEHEHDIDLDALTRAFHTQDLFPDGKIDVLCIIGIIKWASILSTSLTISEFKPGVAPEVIQKDIRFLYRRMLGGDELVYKEKT